MSDLSRQNPVYSYRSRAEANRVDWKADPHYEKQGLILPHRTKGNQRIH